MDLSKKKKKKVTECASSNKTGSEREGMPKQRQENKHEIKEKPCQAVN